MSYLKKNWGREIEDPSFQIERTTGWLSLLLKEKVTTVLENDRNYTYASAITWKKNVPTRAAA